MKKLSVLLLSLLLILSACGKGKENQNNKGSENNKTQVTNTEDTENTENSKNTQSTSSEGGFENVNFDSNMTREECIEAANNVNAFLLEHDEDIVDPVSVKSWKINNDNGIITSESDIDGKVTKVVYENKDDKLDLISIYVGDKEIFKK